MRALRRDVLRKLGQVEREHGLAPGFPQPIEVQVGHFEGLALGGERPASEQRVDVRMPVQKFAVGLDGSDHAGHDVVAAELAPDFRLDARPDRRAQLTQQLAGEGHEHVVVAVATAHAGEIFVQVAAAEKGRDRPLDDEPPVAVLRLEPLVVDPLERVEMPIHPAPQVGRLRIARAVQRQRVAARGSHDGMGTGPTRVYAPSDEPMYPFRQAGRCSRVRNCLEHDGLRGGTRCGRGAPPWKTCRSERLGVVTPTTLLPWRGRLVHAS